MLCRLVRDELRRDTFIHAPSGVYKCIANAPEGVCVRLDLASTGNSDKLSPLFAWMVPTADTPRFGQALTILSSSSFPAGQYHVSLAAEGQRVVRATLSTEHKEAYAWVAENATAVIDRLFLEQVRVIMSGGTLILWVLGRRVQLGVISLEPALPYGIVGRDAELEILPPMLPTFQPTKLKHLEFLQPNSRTRMRVRSAPLQPNVAILNPVDVARLDLTLETITIESEKCIFFEINEEKCRICIIMSELASPGWMHLSQVTMRALRLQQHQWVKFAIVHPVHPTCPIEALEFTAEPFEPWAFFTQMEELLERFLSAKHTKGAIIQGEALVGKTTLAQSLVQNGSVPAYYANLVLLDHQKSLVAKRAGLDEILSKGTLLGPCVYLIDHADLILSVKDEETKSEEEQFLKEQLVHWFLFRVQTLMNSGFPVILIVQSKAELHPTIQSSLLFIKTVTVERPEADLRRKILRECGRQDYFAIEQTRGLFPAQVLHWDGERPENRIKGSELVPDWESIKGLDETKQQLEEALLWPVLFAEFYAKNGFHQPGGVLLYGPSGAGKTLLARAFIKRLPPSIFIVQVAGPELLGKYVGSSERAVRDLFVKARARRPALILLEEADAICPRRGSDNTGTTDRVVNQLLTELDGTESREGVHILAISSRPELIDPAILRPGRINSRILVTFPGHQGRLDVLQALAPIEISSDIVILDQLARETEGFSSADLRAILLDAQLAANGETRTKDRANITPEGLLESLVQYKASRPLPPKRSADSGRSRITFA